MQCLVPYEESSRVWMMLSLAEAGLPSPRLPHGHEVQKQAAFLPKAALAPKAPEVFFSKVFFCLKPQKNQPTSLQTSNLHRTVSLCLTLSVLPVQTSLCLFISVLSTDRALALWREIFPQFCISIVTYLKSQAGFGTGLVCDRGPHLGTSRRTLREDA